MSDQKTASSASGEATFRAAPQEHIPFQVQSGWMPESGHPALKTFVDRIMQAKRGKTLPPSIQKMRELIEGNDVLSYLVNNACKENSNVIANHDSPVNIPAIPNLEALLWAFAGVMHEAPQFVENALVGLPFSAIVVGIDPTLSGTALFRLPMFNDAMSLILQTWNKFLKTEASNTGFRVDGEQWLSPEAKKSYDFPIWKKDSETLPYWKSWNSFFTRQFKDPAKERPIASPDSNEVVICPNDGSVYRWRPNVSREDVFWFKDMAYSLSDILSSPDPAQQKIIDDQKLVEIFEGGNIFQTYLNPYNFHRWWVPVNGTVLFDPLVIPGFFFSKLVIPDYGGATTASLPYLAQVNARGLIVFETQQYGRVCCIPLGMSEVSTVAFDPAMKANAQVSKGQEMGTFQYGGSSFAIIYEKLPGKKLVFENAQGEKYPQNPPTAGSSAGSGKFRTNIGAQIGKWVDLP